MFDWIIIHKNYNQDYHYYYGDSAFACRNAQASRSLALERTSAILWIKRTVLPTTSPGTWGEGRGEAAVYRTKTGPHMRVREREERRGIKVTSLVTEDSS